LIRRGEKKLGRRAQRKLAHDIQAFVAKGFAPFIQRVAPPPPPTDTLRLEVNGVSHLITIDPAKARAMTHAELDKLIREATGGAVYVQPPPTKAMVKAAAKARREMREKIAAERRDRVRLRSRLIAFVNRTPIKKLRYEDSRILIKAVKSYFAEDWRDE